MNVDRLVEHYVGLRDAKAALAEKHREEIAPLDADMAAVERALLVLMQEQHVSQFKSPAGTAFKKEVTGVRVVDFEAALDFVRENERWDLLERRINKTALADVGEVPGVELTRLIVVQIRRAP